MFVDASAIVAIINQEPGWQDFADRLNAAPVRYVSALVRYEAVQAVARASAEKIARNRRPTAEIMEEALSLVDGLCRMIDAEEIAIDAPIGTAAIQASMRYGKAVGHAADLNFGDCFAYACARSRNVPLLYKGEDFRHTDLA